MLVTRVTDCSTVGWLAVSNGLVSCYKQNNVPDLLYILQSRHIFTPLGAAGCHAHDFVWLAPPWGGT